MEIRIFGYTFGVMDNTHLKEHISTSGDTSSSSSFWLDLEMFFSNEA
jgi:hypothetical protein